MLGHLLALLVEEPAEEVLADVLAVLACDLDEPGDLRGDRLLLFERDRDGFPVVGERGLRRRHGRRDDRLVGVEEVLDDHHRVVSLLDRLAVEVGGKLSERCRVVMHGDRDVLLRGGEFARDLRVQLVREPAHRWVTILDAIM